MQNPQPPLAGPRDLHSQRTPDSTLGAQPDLAVQQQLAEINLRQAEINAINLRDVERQTRLLETQRTEIEPRLQTLDEQSQELSQQLAKVAEAEEKWQAAQEQIADADRRLRAVSERERGLEQQLKDALEREVMPECLLAPQFNQWRATILPGSSAVGVPNSNTHLLRASLHMLKAALHATESEGLCRALAEVGRCLYRIGPAETIEEIARALNAAAHDRYSIRLAHVGEPTDKAWMSFSGIASVKAVHSWAVMGPDRLKRHPAEVS